MLRFLSIFFTVLILFFASCEDKEKSNNNSPVSPINNREKEDSIPENKVEVPEKKIEKGDNKNGFTPPKKLEQEKLIPFLTEYGKDNPENRVRITTRFGDIEVILFQDTPLHRANFIYLVKLGYFNNTYFHRVADGFVIQGGNSDNMETSKKRNSIGNYLIPSEFEAGHRHTRGAFSAAKYAEQNVSKASSPFEFFIVQSHRGAHHLDNDHTVFGRVTKGMDVVDEISKQDVSEGEWPLINIHLDIEIIE